MGIETKEKTIGDHAFQVTQLPATKARKLLTRLFKLAGPSVGKALEGLGKTLKQPGVQKKEGEGLTINLRDLDLSKLSDAITLLAQNVFEDDFEYVVAALLEGERVRIQIDGKWPVLTLESSDLIFAGKLDQMFKLIAFALEVNFAGFFGGSGALTSVFANVAAPVSQPSSSPVS